MLKGLPLGILLAMLAIAGSVYYYFSSGHAPVATAAPPMPLEKTLAKIGLNAYLKRLHTPSLRCRPMKQVFLPEQRSTKHSAPCAMAFQAWPGPRSPKGCFQNRRSFCRGRA